MNKKSRPATKKNSKSPLLIISGLLTIAILTTIAILFSQQDNTLSKNNTLPTPSITHEKRLSASKSQTTEQTFKSAKPAPLIDTSLSKSANKNNLIAAQSDQIQPFNPDKTAKSLKFDLSVKSASTNEISPELEVFSLNFDAFDAPETNPPSPLTPLPKEKVKPKNQAKIIDSASFLFTFGIDNQEWDNFISQHIKAKIENKQLIPARRLASYLTSKKNYIDHLGKILSTSKSSNLTSEIITTVESKVSLLSTFEQVQYFSQIGAIQLKAKNNNMFLSQAEKAWESISTATEQLLSAINLAVAFYNAGDMKSAQKYFNIVNTLAYKVESPEQKIQTRIAISQAYKKVGAESLSLKWIVNAEKLLDKAEKKTEQKFVIGYAHLNQIDNVIRLIQQPALTKNQDILAYQAIKVFLDSSEPGSAVQLNNIIQNPVYKALSYTLLAAYTPKNSSYLTLAETLLNTEIQGTMEKAIISSRIAQLYARKNNEQKTQALLLFTKQQIASLSSSSNKERILNTVIINYLRSLNQFVARDLADAIQSPELKALFNKAILNISEVKSLISQKEVTPKV